MGGRKASPWSPYLYSEHWRLEQPIVWSMVTAKGSRNPMPGKVIYIERETNVYCKRFKKNGSSKAMEVSREEQSHMRSVGERDGDGTSFMGQQV